MGLILFMFQMNQHTDVDGDCPLAIVLCRYNDVGCKFKVSVNIKKQYDISRRFLKYFILCKTMLRQ